MAQSVMYGGQAVLEGVMIRGPHGMAVACRRPDGGIAVRTQALGSVHSGAMRRIPLLRGMLILWETLTLGMRALSFASRVAMAPDDEDADLPQTVFWGAIALAVGFIAAVFFATPLALANLTRMLDAHGLAVSLVEGGIRLALLVGYIAVIGLVPGVRRVFQYHGAEHMTVHAHEAGAPLTVEGVRAFAKEHPRCGTSFLLVVMITALVTFVAFDFVVNAGPAISALSRIAFIPPIAAVAYEVLRLGGKYEHHPLARILFVPNMLLQFFTTRAPDDGQIEVALASFLAAAEQEAAGERAPRAAVTGPMAADAALPAGD